MQSFGDLFANNKLLAIGVLLAAVAVILAVGVALFRLVFGRRLHMSGGRTRQPRLGVVDAFDLDRQRQLVLVRRDNVEHLLMIGGPNDVVIEAAIVRAPATLNPRDKENGISAPSVGIPAPVAQPVAPPMVASAAPVPGPLPAIDYEPNAPNVVGVAPRAPEPVSALPDGGVAPEPVSPSSPPQAPPASPDARLPPAAILPAASRTPPGSPGPRPASAMPVRPQFAASSRTGGSTSLPPRPAFSRATPLPPSAAPPASTSPSRVEPSMDRASAGAPVDAPATANKIGADPGPELAAQEVKTTSPGAEGGPTSGSVSPAPATSPSAPAPNVPVAPGTAATPPSRAPAPGGSRSNSPPLRPQPPRSPAAPPQNRAPLPTLGSLEEEMAKLLGRPMPPADKSEG